MNNALHLNKELRNGTFEALKEDIFKEYNEEEKIYQDYKRKEFINALLYDIENNKESLINEYVIAVSDSRLFVRSNIVDIDKSVVLYNEDINKESLETIRNFQKEYYMKDKLESILRNEETKYVFMKAIEKIGKVDNTMTTEEGSQLWDRLGGYDFKLRYLGEMCEGIAIHKVKGNFEISVYHTLDIPDEDGYHNPETTVTKSIRIKDADFRTIVDNVYNDLEKDKNLGGEAI